MHNILYGIYLLTAVGLSPGGSTHLHTNNTQNNTNNNRTTQIQTNVEECGPCPVFASFTLAFALQLGEKHGKTSVRVRKTSVRLRKNFSQSTVYILPKTSTHYKTLTNTHITKPTRTHTHTRARARARAQTRTTKQYKTTTVQIKTKCILEKQHNGEKEWYLVSNVVNSYLFTYNTFIKILYMFRALPCSSSGGLHRNCIYAASGIVISEEFYLKFCHY